MLVLGDKDIWGSYGPHDFWFQNFFGSPLPIRITKEYFLWLQEQGRESQYSEDWLISILQKLKHLEGITEEEYSILWETILSPLFCDFYQTVIASKEGVSKVIYDWSVETKPSVIQSRLDKVKENNEALRATIKECYLKWLLKNEEGILEMEWKKYRKQRCREQDYVLELQETYNKLEVWFPIWDKREQSFFYVKDWEFLWTWKIKDESDFRDILRIDIYFIDDTKGTEEKQVVITTGNKPTFIPVSTYDYSFIETNRNYKWGFILHAGSMWDTVYLANYKDEIKKIRTWWPDPKLLRSGGFKKWWRYISRIEYEEWNNTLEVFFTIIHLYKPWDFLPHKGWKEIDDKYHIQRFKELQRSYKREEEEGITYVLNEYHDPEIIEL